MVNNALARQAGALFCRAVMCAKSIAQKHSTTLNNGIWSGSGSAYTQQTTGIQRNHTAKSTGRMRRAYQRSARTSAATGAQRKPASFHAKHMLPMGDA